MLFFVKPYFLYLTCTINDNPDCEDRKFDKREDANFEFFVLHQPCNQMKV